MTRGEESPDSSGAPVRITGRLNFERTDEPGLFRLSPVKPGNGEVRILILFDGTDYPFERHYRYARHRGAGMPYTFSNTEFRERPTLSPIWNSARRDRGSGSDHGRDGGEFRTSPG